MIPTSQKANLRKNGHPHITNAPLEGESDTLEFMHEVHIPEQKEKFLEKHWACFLDPFYLKLSDAHPVIFLVARNCWMKSQVDSCMIWEGGINY